MKAREAIALVNRVTYKPGWTLKAAPSKVFSQLGINIRVAWSSPDVGIRA